MSSTTTQRSFDFDGGRIQLTIESVEVFRGQLLGSGIDHTGLLVWPATHLLVDWLLEHRQWLKDAVVVELGAGAGLCGILASKLGPQTVILTDRDSGSLDLLRLNASANKGTCDVRVARLPWGDEECSALLPRQEADVVLGADILYPSIPQDVVKLLFDTAKRLLKPTGRLVLSFIARDGKQTLRAMLRSAKEMEFSLEQVLEGNELRGARQESTSLGARVFIYTAGPAGGRSMEEVEGDFDRVVDALLPGVWQDPEPTGKGSEDEEEEWRAPFDDDDDDEMDSGPGT